MNLAEMKSGDKVYIFTPDGKIHRGEATLISVDADGIVMDCVPAGTSKGDLLMGAPEYEKWLAKVREAIKIPYHVVKIPTDYFLGVERN